MGKKINPNIFRIKQIRTWDSKWFSVRNYKNFLQQDVLIKEYLRKKLLHAFVSTIQIERTTKDVNITIFSARPGVIIGRGGTALEDMKKDISRQFVKDKNIKVNITIKEIENINLDANIIAQGIKFDIEKRMPFRRAMKQAIAKAEKARAKGIKVQLSGRLNGVEIARQEKLIKGKVPLHTLRADIDYAFIEANTIYGKIGIKVWVYKGDVFLNKKDNETDKKVEDTKEVKNK